MSVSADRAAALLDRMLETLADLESIAVGFSGGVDSTVVVAAAARALGRERVLAVTAESETLPASELAAACELAERLDIPHLVIRTRELEDENFSSNPVDRCYYCKSELWGRIRKLADKRGLRHVADGVNADDTGDLRPGIKAGDELGVVHPLVVIGAGKDEVRVLARQLGLPNSEKPAQACLSSRFPYGCEITPAGLRRVEQAEEYLRQLGFGQLRVRSYGDIARIEVPAERIGDLLDGRMRENIASELKGLGFGYVTLDLEGFRSGSMNEIL